MLSGLWHGAAWTVVIWGAIHGTYMVVGEVTGSFGSAGGVDRSANGGLAGELPMPGREAVQT